MRQCLFLHCVFLVPLLALEITEWTSRSNDVPNPSVHLQRLGYPSRNSLRFFDNYILSYDSRLRISSWIFEHLTNRSVYHNANLTDRDLFRFKEDKEIQVQFRVRDKDYRNNRLNMSRGHMAAAANHQISLEHKQNTYYFSNIAPQVGSGFNNGVWSSLEDWVRRLTMVVGHTYVVTGPLFLPQHDGQGEFVTYRLIGESRVAVPTHFFKVVLAERNTQRVGSQQYSRWTFVVPHEKTSKGFKLESFLADIQNLQRDTGLLFFDQVPVKNIHTHLNTSFPLNVWVH